MGNSEVIGTYSELCARGGRHEQGAGMCLRDIKNVERILLSS